MAMIDPIALSRLKWHSRRGMLENDLVLTAFFRRHEAALDTSEARGLAALLALEDGDLWDLIAARSELAPDADRAVHSVLEKLRECTTQPAISI